MAEAITHGKLTLNESFVVLLVTFTCSVKDVICTRLYIV